MSEVRKRHKTKDTIKEAIVQNDKEAGKSSENKEPAPQRSSISSLRIISRVSVILSLLTIVYFSTKDDNFNTFAKQSDILPGKGQIIECSLEYLQEINKYEGCRPKECKRFVTDKVVSLPEVKELLLIAKKGLKLGGSVGGASILDLHSGALSLGQNFVNIYKIDRSKDVFQESDFNIYRIIKEKIKYAVAHHFDLNPDNIYLTHPTFFSEITSKEAVTVHDEYWHPHVDKVPM
ncbi:PKHD domain-containing transmembrane protein [Operophtera brumata]|uniref:PKHD domain-containing transmembrane protein n=1 Tax=Operophtera brumata TaxID=104452 RepID=A0A0L7KVN8_OPEBR|nr:PKHD domain-containing transmembrane protein [Operophtera brumata]